MKKHGRNRRPGSSEFDLFIGGRLRQERRLAGRSRAALGEALGVSEEIIAKYEEGEQPAPAHRLAAAAAALGVPVSALFYDGTRGEASAGKITEQARWLAIRRPLKFLCHPDFAQLVPLLSFWQERGGAFSDDVEGALSAGGILDRTILVRRSPGSSLLETEHFGAQFAFLRPSDIVGRAFQDQPDREYAAWMADAYTELLDHRGLRVEACRAIIHRRDKTTIGARYDRLLIPWHSRGLDQFAMSVCLRRGDPIALPSGEATLAP